jgi:uncharacterized protein (TIGR02145 family)
LSQTPQAIKYQTVARNNAGEILASQNISFRMTILQGELPGTVVYAETHTTTTNATGLATLEIGKGTVVSGNFSAINWGTTPVFLKTEIDPAGGSAFVEMGTSELLSVPYALYAKTAGNGFSGNYNDLINKPALWDSTWLTIKNKPTTVSGYGITDAMTTAHPANGITPFNIANWNTAFGWGNHSAVGYLTSFTETDPIWNAASVNYYTKTNMQTSGAAVMHFNNLTNKPNTVAGYGISDAMTTTHAANGITVGNIANWNTAFDWGNHATMGYLTSFTEVDPIWNAASGDYYTKINLQTSGAAAVHFNNLTNKPTTVAGYGITNAMTTAHPANGITSGNISTWNTAFGWGNHATAGYLTSFTETDPIFTVHPAKGITAGIISNWNAAFGWGNHAMAGYLTSFTETDPVFAAHPAKGITAGNISNWNTAFGWGNHATAGYLTSFTETDPIFAVHPAKGITAGNISNWNTAFGWGNHATAGYLTSFTETDPIFAVHPAKGITAGNITNWNTAYTNRITAATGTAPLTLTISGNQLTGSIAAANSTTSGYLTTADWNSFNNKVSSQWVTSDQDISYNTGKVGIGTSNPQSKIDIAGNAVIGSTYSGTNAAPANGLLVEGQVGVGTTAPASSALAELSSTSKGFLPPRMTTVQMNSIISPVEGLTIYNTTIKTLCWFDGTSWTYVPQDRKSCGTISYEGKTYETVVIGSQCWMKQNINVGTMIDVSVGQTNDSIVEKYCYNNDEANCDVYGGFYQWDELMNWTSSSATNPSGRQGICPTGWHIPSDAEWCQVYTYLDPALNCENTSWLITDAGAKMRETGTSHWASSVGTNTSGFTALGTGFAYAGSFYYFNVSAAIWSATEYSDTDAWYFYLYTDYTWIAHDHCEKAMGNSARCVKD